MKNHLQQAYELGVKLAAADAGLVKLGADEGGSLAWPALLGGVGGAIAAPEGKTMRGFGGAMGGSMLGGLGGAAGGGAAGAGLGAILSALLKKPGLAGALGLGGGYLGGVGGGMYGGAKGYQAAVED